MSSVVNTAPGDDDANALTEPTGLASNRVTARRLRVRALFLSVRTTRRFARELLRATDWSDEEAGHAHFVACAFAPAGVLRLRAFAVDDRLVLRAVVPLAFEADLVSRLEHDRSLETDGRLPMKVPPRDVE